MPPEERLGAACEPIGMNDGTTTGLPGDGIALKFGDIEERFRLHTRLRFKDGTETRDMYLTAFRRLWDRARLWDMTRRQLVTKGRDLLLEHPESIPAKSRRWNLAALECVWIGPMALVDRLESRRRRTETVTVGT